MIQPVYQHDVHMLMFNAYVHTLNIKSYLSVDFPWDFELLQFLSDDSLLRYKGNICNDNTDKIRYVQ